MNPESMGALLGQLLASLVIGITIHTIISIIYSAFKAIKSLIFKNKNQSPKFKKSKLYYLLNVLKYLALGISLTTIGNSYKKVNNPAMIVIVILSIVITSLLYWLSNRIKRNLINKNTNEFSKLK